MAEPAHAHAGPSDDSPCYNCGGRGHWIVACPEPTRKTPAGLANAWRNAPNAQNASQGNHRQHHGGNSKRANKGPIITKYAPPPPPPPPPPSSHPSSLSHGTAAYPPLPPAPSYPQQSPQFQAPYGHYQPAAHYPPGYGSTYPQQQYHQPSYGAAPAAPAGYAAHPPGPPAPQPPAPAHYPATYSSYPPAGPSSTPGYPPQTTYTQPYSQPPYGLPPVPYPVHSGPAHYPPPPPKPPHTSRPSPGLNQPIHHSLPPKPPRSVHTQQEPHRDHRNRRKHDRQNKFRDNRRRDQNSRHRSSQQKSQNKANRSNRVSRSSRSQKATTSTNTEKAKSGLLPLIDDLQKNGNLGSEGSNEGSNVAEISASDNAQASRHEDDQSRQSISGEPDEESETADSESGESTDGEGLEPARVLLPDDAELPAQGDGHLSPNRPDHVEGEASTARGMTPDMDHLNGKHKRRDHGLEDERQPKKSKASTSLADASKHSDQGKQAETQHGSASAAPADDVPTAEEENGTALPLLEPESRSRSKERHQRPKSRNSSVSSRSSDLNSLEAELLGRPAKQRSPDDIDVPQRQDRAALPKMQRRRQPNADSAYGRRW